MRLTPEVGYNTCVSSSPGPGDRIGRFRLLGRLGSGGMGVVHDALEENLERRVALKVIAPDLAGDPDFRARFAVEARALASLDSPHVVAVHAYGEEDGHLYLATQLIADGDLGRLLRERGPAPLGQGAGLVAQVAEGLADAHAAGLAHRDIKPANVLVRRRGTGPTTTLTAYLGDFGIARRLDDVIPSDGTAVAGTPSYLAPELHQGTLPGVASDLYSVGCLLWVVLTGSPPYPGATDGEILQAHQHARVPQLHGSGEVVDALNRVLRRALAKDPADRYQRAGDLAADLRRVAELDDDPAFHARAGSPAVLPAAAVPSASRRLRVLVAAVALAVVTGAGLVVLSVPAGDFSTDGRTSATEAGFDDDAARLLAAAAAAMGALETVRVTGDVRSGDDLLGVDLAVSARGDCAGTISLGGGSARLRRVGARTWFRADEAFWVAAADAGRGPSIARAVGDRWVLVPPDDASSFGPVCDLDDLLTGASGPQGAPGPGGRRAAEVLGTATASGREVLRVATGADGFGLPAGPGAVVSVALDDPHHLLHVESGHEGALRFSEFDTPFEVRAPASGAVVDLGGFGG